MPLVPTDAFPFCGPTYLASSPLIDCQRSINLYPDPGIGSSKTRMGLTGRPGLGLFGDPSTSSQSPGHSLWAGNQRLFAAIGTHVYEVDNGGAMITNYGAGLGNFGPYPTPMIANGTQLMIVDTPFGKVFNINPGGPSLDLVFNGVALEYLDGFYVAIATGASLAGANPNQINVSANGDGTTWPGLAFAIRTGAADLTNQLAVLNGLLWVFGQKSIEIWYNAGNPIFPFARVNGGTLNLGCLAPFSVVKFQNTIMWLGGDDQGYGQVYMAQGMNPVRVSNPAIEGMLEQANLAGVKLISSKAYGYQEAGHTFYVLQLCNGTYNTQQELVYDLTTGLWHERTYGAIFPQQFASVANFGTINPNFVMDENSGKIYNQGINYFTDDGDFITYTRTAPHVGSENRWYKYPRFELDADIGTAQPILDYSNDGGRNFLGYNYPLIQAQDQGAPGTAKRFYKRQLGRSRDRVFKVTITDRLNPIRIANAYLTAEAGQ